MWTDRHAKANSRNSATPGTRLNKTWVTRTERHVPQTVMLPVTPLLSHHFITSSMSTANITFNAFPLQTLSFRQPTVSVHSEQTKHASTHSAEPQQISDELAATNSVAVSTGRRLLNQHHVKTKTFRKWPSTGHTCYITNRH